MNPEQQRIAISEACGKWHSGWPHEYMNQADRLRHIPDYLNDLNAMNDAEKVLTKANWGGYAAELYRITDAHNHGISPNHHWLAVAFSTATQRAEAFLRTIGKWEESR
jgi:hypothetical protein